jgi:hypothetical protein
MKNPKPTTDTTNMSECQRFGSWRQMASRIRCSQPFPSFPNQVENSCMILHDLAWSCMCSTRPLTLTPVASCDIHHTQIGTIDRSHTNSRGSECDVLQVTRVYFFICPNCVILYSCAVVQCVLILSMYKSRFSGFPRYVAQFWPHTDQVLATSRRWAFLSFGSRAKHRSVSQSCARIYKKSSSICQRILQRSYKYLMQRSCKCVKACKELQYKVTQSQVERCGF